ncbi:MAG: helix-turn-helix transcriptional regulator [Candidatus Sulfotelmatobacter sp.]
MSSDEAKLFRKRLRTLRKAKGLSQSELEEKIGKGANYITRVETGRIGTPPREVVAEIARELDVSMGDLHFYEGIDEGAKVLRARIHRLAETDDVKRLRKFYRHMLVSIED